MFWKHIKRFQNIQSASKIIKTLPKEFYRFHIVCLTASKIIEILMIIYYYIFSFTSCLKEFELPEFDIEDAATSDISTCFKDVTTNSVTVKQPTNALGRVCKSLLAKQKHSLFMTLHSPLESLPSLLPANIDIGESLPRKFIYM